MHCSFVLSLITETDNEAISLPFSFQPHPWMSIVRHDLCRDTSTLWCNHLASPWSHSSVLLAQGLRGSAAHQRYALCCFNYRAAKQPGWAVAITWYYFVMEREGRGLLYMQVIFFFQPIFFVFFLYIHNLWIFQHEYTTTAWRVCASPQKQSGLQRHSRTPSVLIE